MDWGNDYFTFSDTNIEYIWRFLKIVHERGWLYVGHRATEWCPRCGTSLSQHELTQSGVYQEKSDPSLFVRFPLLDRKGESVVVWTTTPWTLPANVAAAVNPAGEYGLRDSGEWVLAAALPRRGVRAHACRGEELVGLALRGPVRQPRPGARRSSTGSSPGTRSRSRRAPGSSTSRPAAAARTSSSAARSGCRCWPRSTRPAASTTTTAGCTASRRPRRPTRSSATSASAASWSSAGTYLHNYPHCWRCDTPLIFRISDDWFIGVDGVRPRLLEENAKVEWVPAYMGKRMDDWLRNMGDWNISRRRYYGLPLPFYPCSCGHLNVIGSKDELAERALEGLDQLAGAPPSRGSTASRSAARPAASRSSASLEVGDVWLDAGIVPFSTLGWQNPEWKTEGYATGAAAGLTKADLPDHAYWEKWFPADWVTEMREQIRLWFYSQFFMSVVLVDRSPYTRVLGYEKMLDEHGREMHGSWGNMIDAEDAFERMGADVMRWQYCAQPPDRNLLFGFGPAHEIKRKLLTFWNSTVDARHLREHRGLRADRRRPRDRPARRAPARPLDGRAHPRARRVRRRRPTRRR